MGGLGPKSIKLFMNVTAPCSTSLHRERERERERESVLLGNNVHNEGFQRSAPRRGGLARRAQTGRYPLPVRTSRARRAHLAFVGMFASPYVRKTNRGRRDTSATRQERQS